MWQIYSTQHYLESVGKLQDHCDTLEDIRNDFLTQGPLEAHIEGLQDQLEAAQVCLSLQVYFFVHMLYLLAFF